MLPFNTAVLARRGALVRSVKPRLPSPSESNTRPALDAKVHPGINVLTTRTIGSATKHYDRATNAHFRPDKPRDATGKSLIVLNPWLTLNQRVPGSSPGAPTKEKTLLSNSFAKWRPRTKRVSCDVFVWTDAARLLCGFSLFLYLHPIRYSTQIRWYRSIT